MSRLPQTKALALFLNKNPQVRAQIAATRAATVLYAGRLIHPAWMEIDEWKKSMPQMATKKTRPRRAGRGQTARAVIPQFASLGHVAGYTESMEG